MNGQKIRLWNAPCFGTDDASRYDIRQQRGAQVRRLQDVDGSFGCRRAFEAHRDAYEDDTKGGHCGRLN